MVRGVANYGQLNKFLGTQFSLFLLVPAVLGTLGMLLVARSFSIPVDRIKLKYFRLSKGCWFFGTLILDNFVQFLLLRKKDTGMRDIARPRSHCANAIRQSFKDFQKGYGVRKCVQLCPEKKIIPTLLEESHAAFFKGEEDREKNYDREGKTDAENRKDAS